MNTQTRTYIKTIRKINKHFFEWTDTEIINLCLANEIDKRLGGLNFKDGN